MCVRLEPFTFTVRFEWVVCQDLLLLWVDFVCTRKNDSDMKLAYVHRFGGRNEYIVCRILHYSVSRGISIQFNFARVSMGYRGTAFLNTVTWKQNELCC